MKPEDKAREAARDIAQFFPKDCLGLYGDPPAPALTVPDRGNVQFAANGDAFVELTLQISAGMLK